MSNFEKKVVPYLTYLGTRPILQDELLKYELSHAGGLTEVKKIASMAEAYDVALAPHCPLGPIALAACLNVDATCYNAVIQEQSRECHVF